MYRSPLVYLAPFAALALIACAAASFLFIFVSFGLPPCSDPSAIHALLSWLVPISFLSAAALVVRLMFKGSWRSGVFAILMPLVAIAAYAVSAGYEAGRQSKCTSQNLQEAMNSCRATPANYRRGKDQYGYYTLTLVAPGTTDAAWNCLWRWSLRKGSISLNVDESVYPARQSARPR